MPGVPRAVEDGEKQRFNLDAYCLALARPKLHSAPANQPLRRFGGCRWQAGINFRNFCSTAIARVPHGKCGVNVLALRYFQIRISKLRVRQPEAKWKQHGLLLSVVPLVSDFQAFVVVSLECRKSFQHSLPMIRPRRRFGAGRGLDHGRMRQIGFASRKRNRQLSTRVHVAKKNIG